MPVKIVRVTSGVNFDGRGTSGRLVVIGRQRSPKIGGPDLGGFPVRELNQELVSLLEVRFAQRRQVRALPGVKRYPRWREDISLDASPDRLRLLDAHAKVVRNPRHHAIQEQLTRLDLDRILEGMDPLVKMTTHLANPPDWGDRLITSSVSPSIDLLIVHH